MDVGPHCLRCRRDDRISCRALGVCGACILSDFDRVRNHVARVHAKSRAEFGLPAKPPDTPGGVRCRLCANECVIGGGEFGFCGLRTVENGRIRHLVLGR